ncbi:MAG: hypothetical protein JXA18_14685 [Chitinispirillaceae bacterium]|nr:hypothetical protein [Chitinispirillaceae bacterium]
MHVRGFIFLFLMSLPTYALIDFYGYRSYQTEIDTMIDDSIAAFTVTRYKQVLMGYSELEISEITVFPRGVYLDITEDAWISSDVNKLNISGLTGDYLFKGTVPVPQEAIVTGLQTWRGERLYRAMLREAKYIVDIHFDDSITLQQSLDSRIALLQQHTETVFEITLARVALGERIHVRIRYLLRPIDTNTGLFSIPVLFHTAHGKRPQYIRFNVFANDDDQRFTLTSSTGQFSLDDTLTTMVPYEAALSLQHDIQRRSFLNLTEFTGGTYLGNYCAVNTGVTDSTITRLSKPIATVFIWRWNGPQPMIAINNQVKTLSRYAWDIIDQAKRIRETISELHRLGNSCALIHSIEGNNHYAFESKGINSISDSSLIAYLQSMNEMALFEKYRNEPAEPPDWVVEENENETVIQKARDEFLNAISDAGDLLSSESGKDFRHIIMISIGTASNTYLEDLHESISLDNDGITVFYQSVPGWRGVDITASLPASKLFPWSNYSFPAFSPVTIQLSVSNADQPFSFPLKKQSWEAALTFTARTAAAWDTILTWTGFDSEGKPTRTITEQPQVFRHHADSGLAKLWAGDHSHIAEKEEIYPGGTFGILTKATYLQATKENIADDISRSVPYLTDDEIQASRSSSVSNRIHASQRKTALRIIHGNLHIFSPRQFTALKVFDLQGRLLLHLDLKNYASPTGGFIIPLGKFLKTRRFNMLVIQLSGKGCRETFNIINGRVQ